MPPSDCLRDKTLPTLAGGRSLSTTITASSIVHVGPNTAHHLRHRHLLCDVAHNRYTIEESRKGESQDDRHTIQAQAPVRL